MRNFFIFPLIFIATLGHAADAPLSFQDALKSILERSTDVQKQEAVLGEVKAQNLPSHLILLPSVSASATRRYNKQDDSDQTRTQDLSATAQMNLFHFGADFARMKAANAHEDAETYALDSQKLSTEQQAALTIFDFIAGQQLANLFAKDVEIREESVRIARERYKRGLLPLQEVMKVSIDLENAKNTLRESEIEKKVAEQTLQHLLGNTNISSDWPWKAQLMARPQLQLLQETQASLTDRPDLKEAQSRVDQSDQETSMHRGLFLPSLDLNFTYGNLRSLQPSEDPSNYWSGALTLSFPLFDRLSQYGNYRASVYRRTQAEASLVQTQRHALQEFNTAQTSAKLALESAVAMESVLTSARKIYQDSSLRFKQGHLNANDLELDESRLTQTERNAIQNWKNLHASLTKLCHSRGQDLKNCLK